MEISFLMLVITAPIIQIQHRTILMMMDLVMHATNALDSTILVIMLIQMAMDLEMLVIIVLMITILNKTIMMMMDLGMIATNVLAYGLKPIAIATATVLEMTAIIAQKMEIKTRRTLM